MVLALIILVRRLRPYFQAHTIAMLTDLPLRQILSKHELSGHLINWSVELSEFDLQYQARRAIKSQVLANFIAECTLPDEGLEAAPDTPSEEPISETSSWALYIDRSSTLLASGARVILISPDEATFEYSLQFAFSVSNNEAEYEALITSLKHAKELKIFALQIFYDSQLVVGQINGEFEAWSLSMIKYLCKF